MTRKNDDGCRCVEEEDESDDSCSACVIGDNQRNDNDIFPDSKSPFPDPEQPTLTVPSIITCVQPGQQSFIAGSRRQPLWMA